MTKPWIQGQGKCGVLAAEAHILIWGDLSGIGWGQTLA
jgi:hypothetical protein